MKEGIAERTHIPGARSITALLTNDASRAFIESSISLPNKSKSSTLSSANSSRNTGSHYIESEKLLHRTSSAEDSVASNSKESDNIDRKDNYEKQIGDLDEDS
jgi:hypothetical protein